ncbi:MULTISPECIES: TIGR03943 family putative permease subunit [Microbacterium]|uniref:TIGR03943 family protein n=1 Tax=Microbacterium saccharophilum TaxID=1213358 RepID=A0A7Z7GD83_9MICO|nr:MULTISPECIES: TIGR03943 family protein [Microbacterium]SFI50559.1 TIGR03943 family protein [Microbacterium saccharophilum]
MPRLLGTRLLGVGLTAALAAVTLALAVTDRLGLYINPDSTWFAVSMAVLALAGAVLSFALPLGEEADHGHGHGEDHGHDYDHVGHADGAHAPGGITPGGIAALTGGILATGLVGAIVLVPPATLSAELAMSRDTGTAPLFQGADNVALAATGDTASFGVGEWASVFATATNPDAFDGDEITLTGFVTPGEDGFDLTRLVITHCVIDAQPARIPITAADAPETGEWVTVTGTIRDVEGRLHVQATSVDVVAEPEDPYEY